MLATDEPVLTAVKAKVEALTFSEFTLNAVYRFPDDFTATPDLTVPFAVVGAGEEGMTVSGSTFGMQSAAYSVFIRFYFEDGGVTPTTAEYAAILTKAREVYSLVGGEIFTDQEFFGSTAMRAGDVEMSDVYIIQNAPQPYTGCQVEVPISQEI